MTSAQPKVQLVCSYEFCAAHQLKRSDWDEAQNKKVFGRCANVHGHQYRIELHLEGNIDSDTGMLINEFTVSDLVTPFFNEQFDHKFLNQDVPFFKEHLPTGEWIAVWIYQSLHNLFPDSANLIRVVVHETPSMKACYPA